MLVIWLCLLCIRVCVWVSSWLYCFGLLLVSVEVLNMFVV